MSLACPPRIADCGRSLPPQDAAIGNPENPRRFRGLPKWKKAMDGFFHGQLARLLALAWLSIPVATPPATAEPPASPRAEVSLKDRLVTGLRAVRPDDVDYCERVAQATRTGQLPGKLVDRTYFWAIGRGSDFPLPAFAKALEFQCRRLGIAWP